VTFIGIDPSLSGTGLAGDITGATATRTVIPGKLTGLARLHYVVKEISNYVQEYTHTAGTEVLIGMEDYTAMSMSAATTPLKELGGCIKLELHRLGFELHKVPRGLFIQNQSQMKKWWFKDGSMAKTSRYLLEVKNITGIDFPDDNQADAWMHMMMLKQQYFLATRPEAWELLVKEQREVLCSMVRSVVKNSPSLARLMKLGDSELMPMFMTAWATP
jgi:hypothetical protein